jgi:hypothetical protein
MKKLLLLVFLLVSNIGWATACPTGYSSSQKYVISHFLVPNTDQANFPAVITFNGGSDNSITLADLKVTGSGGLVQSSTGLDIIFCDAASAGNLLSFERVTYVDTTGKSVFWIKFASLSHTTDNNVWMFYGKAGASDLSDPTGTYSNSFRAVMHYEENAASTTVSDVLGNFTSMTSSSNTSSLTTSSGKFGSAFTYTPTTTVTMTNTAQTISGAGARTMCGWIKTNGTQNSRMAHFGYGASSNQLAFEQESGIGGNGEQYFVGFAADVSSTFIVGNGNWHRECVAYTGTVINMYGDGRLSGTTTSTLNTTASNFTVGKQDWSDSGNFWPFNGIIDEVTFSTVARSADWIATEYNNQSSPITFFVPVSTAGSCSGYSFKRSITVDHTKVPNTDRTNFPMLVNGTYSWLATVANGGNLQSSSGFDVCYASDSAGSTGLPYDTDHWTATSGDAGYWVLVPTIATGSDTVIYIFYGNSSITTTQANPTAVWGPDYKTVYHLGNGTTLSLADSGITGNLLTQTGTVGAAAGMIGGSALFTSGNYLSNTGLGYPIATTTRVMSMWMKFTSLSSGIRIAGYGSAGVQGEDFRWEWTSPNFSLSIGNGSKFGTWSQDTNWHYVVAVFSGTTNANITIYMDGALFGSTSSVNVWTLNTPGCCVALSGSAGSSQFPGNIDEFRIRTGSETADWIATEYNNQNSPSTFYTISGPTSIAHKRRMSQVY